MDRDAVKRLLEQVQTGATTVDDAVARLAYMPYQVLDGARVDHHRALRQGIPEVVFGAGKSPAQIAAILHALLDHSPRAVATRVDANGARQVQAEIPDASYQPTARMLIVDRDPLPRHPGVAVLCAGTSDLAVADEAALIAGVMGCEVRRVDDVGVAGLHRLLDVVPDLQQARAIVVVAGMDGALPSVAAGMVSVPVIAVPTSVGYGASFGGVAALLTMLNSCAVGVSVVNIDNGFGAGVIAAMINRGQAE